MRDDLTDGLSPRQLQILKKLVRLLSVREGISEYSVSLTDFIGRGFDDANAARIARLVRKMERIVLAATLNVSCLRLRIDPEAIPLLCRLAKQSKGNPWADAALALKMALGIKGDVNFSVDFDHENFNYGECTGYLDIAPWQDSRWHMDFGDRLDLLKRYVSIRPVADGIRISMNIACAWPESKADWRECLGVIPVCDFTDPEKFQKLLPEITAKSRALLDRARHETRELLQVGEAYKPDVLRDMRKACAESDSLCEFFETEPEVRQIPEWPLGCEPKGCCRVFECSVEEFWFRFLPGLNVHFQGRFQQFTSGLWLCLFREKYGIFPDPEEIEDFGEDGCEEDLRERYPDKDIVAEFRQALKKARIRIAWGLVTSDFTKIRAFIDCVMSYPGLESRITGLSPWEMTCEPELGEMRKCLADAEKCFLAGEKKDGYRLALQAEKEWLETGAVQVRCPKCGEVPEVDRNSHRVWVQCPCGFVRMGELREI